MVTGLGIDATHRSEHLRSEEDVVGVDHTAEQVDAGLVVDARLEEDVPHHVPVEGRPAEPVGQPAVAAPVVRHCSAAVRDHEPQRREASE